MKYTKGFKKIVETAREIAKGDNSRDHGFDPVRLCLDMRDSYSRKSILSGFPLSVRNDVARVIPALAHLCSYWGDFSDQLSNGRVDESNKDNIELIVKNRLEDALKYYEQDFKKSEKKGKPIAAEEQINVIERIKQNQKLTEDRYKNAKVEISKFLKKYRGVKRIIPINERLKISDEQLEKLVQHIKPVVQHNGKLFYIKDVHPKKVAFTWSPKITEEAKGLEKLARIKTYHTYGYYGFFKPSIAEVLAQIPKRYIDLVKAFEIPVKLNDPEPEVVGDYHLSRTILYLPEKLKNKEFFD